LVERRIVESGGELVRRRLGVISVGCITGEGDGVGPDIVLKTRCGFKGDKPVPRQPPSIFCDVSPSAQALI
jgi:hypothetical protein